METTSSPERDRDARTSRLVLSLANQISELARVNRLPEGTHLTEQWIAGELQVSRSPIRRALALLREIGIVRHVANRGYFLTRPGQDLEPVDDAPPEDDDEIYFRVVDDFLHGRLDHEFTAAGVARRFAVPVRTVQRTLVRLEGEDLLRRKPGRGWEFQGILSTTQGHEDSYRFRMIVEPAALLEPGFTVDAEALALQRERQEALLRGQILSSSRRHLFQANAEFHETLVGSANNPFLLDALRRQNRIRRLIEYRYQFDRGRMVAQAREHLLLLDLVEAGRMEEAARALRMHLDRVRWIKTGVGAEPPILTRESLARTARPQ
ncbi:GntR family transcriptional regulator [Spiractinospora alimapuensis]|uniref:GntR family transcriptional regulator n=1 Tax=Spiractinospora alimapuensis TaxID=2820884 RepID=UPI001F445C09|nr:GntR family transcriptional regulator [Spiractinospora alimapuensis]QVQ52191.1 GntR family transcriptional regulator [Spiractinospora alimapuensis]